MTEKEYRSYPAISRSQLWKIRESPEKFRYYEDNPQPPTPALLFGQVVHKLLLQPEDFDSEFAVLPDIDRRTKDGKAAYSDFLAAAEGKSIITLEQYETAVQMTTKALSEPFVAKLLNGQREVPFFWTDEMTGEDCKCRVDCLTEIGNNLIIVDYKTCTNASNDGFMRDAIKYGYAFQAAMYSDGVEKNTGRKPLFVFIAQEKVEPYSVNVLQAGEAFVQYGYDVYRELLGVYHYCRTTNNWYGLMGRDGIINNLSLPAWLARE